MIGFLRGLVALRDDPYLIVEASGVGYKVIVPTGVLTKAGGNGQEVSLFTHTHVRENALELYGFLDHSDLKMFEMLLSVSGIGPKTALGIFAIGDAQTIRSAIASADMSFFTTIPRLGRKNAQKIIIELKGKLGSVSELDLSEKDARENADVISALRSFGFTNREATEAIRATSRQGKTTEEKVRLALRHLGK